MRTETETERRGPRPGTRWCWQCNAGGYVVPANKINPKGGSPSLIKCGVCNGEGWIDDPNGDTR